MLRQWETIVPENDRQIFETAGFHQRQEFGKRPALLVVDVVLSFTGSKRTSTQEAIKEFASSCGEAGWDALPKISRLIQAARDVEIPVIYTKGSAENKFHCGDTIKGWASSRQQIDQIYLAPIHPDIQPQDEEWVLEKTKASAFFGTPLTSYLFRNGCDCVIVCGTSTSGCVRATCLDAWSHSIPTFVVEDCCFDRSPFFHNVTLYDLSAKYANVVTLDEVVSLLERNVSSLQGA